MKRKSILILALMLIVALGLNYLAFFGVSIAGYDYDGVFDEERGIRKGIDLAGGSVISFQANKPNPSEAEMDVVEAIFKTRLTSQGYSEARISRDSDKITVEIPSVFETDSAASLLGSMAKLTFVDSNNKLVLDGATGIKTADYAYEPAQNGGNPENIVKITFSDEASEKFAAATREAAAKAATGENYIAIMMDDDIISAPRVSSEIRSSCIISGNFTTEEAKQLANQIKSGQLPFSLSVITKDTIGAELGKDALPTSLTAAGIGIVLIMIFMIIIYGVNGLIADLALLIYVGIVSLILGLARVNLSLSGIAGVILSIGMAVDANVIIFERMKEELRVGKTIKASVDAGFSKAFSAIFDSNITTFITCVVLYMSGIGTLSGFALTLGIGVAVSMFTAIVITKFLLKQLVHINVTNRKLFRV
ncbi:MAG: protein translocase subunit SecD [Oscillospiraceae bacterium]|nr:protein translocase subunit SecD [Oscillospiraceae bacterium]